MKKCEVCGKTFDDDQTVCDVCGVELVEVPAEAAPTEENATEAASTEETKTEETKTEAKKSFDFKALGDKFKAMDKKTKIICGAVAAVVLIALIAIICSVCKPKSNAINRDAIALAYSSEEGIAYVYNGNNKVKKLSSDETKYTMVARSVDGKTMVVYGSEKNSSDITYYVLTIKGLVEIGDDVTNAVISADGSAVAYLSETSGEVGELRLFTAKGKKDIKLDEDVLISNIVISPDGKSVAYAIKDDNGDTKVLYSKNGKDGEVVAKNAYPVAISNGAKYVYYVKTVDNARNLYVLKGKDSVKLADVTYGVSTLYFNADLSELIFNDDGKAYITVKAGEKKKISNNTISNLFVTANDKSASISSARAEYQYTTVKSFKNTIAYMNGAYYKITSKYETSKILSADDIGYIIFSDDLKSCVYYKNGSFYKIANVNKSDNKKKLGDMDDYSISSVVVLRDMNSIYFVSDGDLYYKKGTGKPKKVATDAKLIGGDYEANGVYYYIEYDSKDTNTLYFSKNGSKKKVVAKDIKSTSTTYGSYRIFSIENKKDDSLVDLYTVKGTSKKKLLTK